MKQKAKHFIVAAIGIIVIMMGLEILILGKSSVPSAGWHFKGQSLPRHNQETYEGVKRLTGLWFVAIGSFFCYVAVKALKNKPKS